jgi:hypothetical protein
MNSKQKGVFLPTTQVWDVNQIYETKDISPGMRELLVRMYQNLNLMATVINQKDTGIYPTDEFVCGQQYFPKPGLTSASSHTPKLRQVLRKTIPWVDGAGAYKSLPNAVLDSVPHGLTFDANTIVTRIYGASTNPTARRYIPIPFIDCKSGYIGIWATGTDIVIDCCGFDGTDFTITNIVIEYIKF